MPLAEFSLIERFFAVPSRLRDDVVLGIGDDAAVVNVSAGEQLAVAVDTMVAGVHFPHSAHAADVGYKALAVNLSDMAAMGATPRWATLALTLPHADEHWVASFAQGFFDLAERFGVALVGGDTTRGPLAVSVQILGTVPRGRALTRAGARAGDCIYVSGTLGDAGLALRLLHDEQDCAQGSRALLDARLHRPEPRVALGGHLRGVAGGVIDVSDGLLADLMHVLEASAVGATLDVDAVPRSNAFRACVEPNQPAWMELPLAGGDDYELCFTAAPEYADTVQSLAQQTGVPIALIGVIDAQPGLRCRYADGREFRPARRGYEHFG